MSRYNDLSLEFGNLILKAREEANMTQGALASAIDSDFRLISEYERGKKVPSAILFLKIAQALNVSPESLTPDCLKAKCLADSKNQFVAELTNLNNSINKAIIEMMNRV